uniref:Cytochrome c oxidase subunit 2 n=2 Tax=Cumberlandia monodonta TaxID=52365 RepID=A0A1X9JIB4_CUMMO|nr:cytochrome c oxidase subunit 2 [Cumberlandia monodonta]
MSLWGQFGFQEGATVLGIEISDLYDHVMFFSVLVFSFVGYLFCKMLMSVFTCRVLLEKQWLEFIWTFLPAGVLLAIGLPSVHLLYVMEDVGAPQITVKAIGHQWYWSYEYCDLGGEDSISFDSYMVPSVDLVVGSYRLLDVDNRFVVPYGVPMRVLVSSSDVIHSWAIPSAGVKVDGVVGRVNQAGLGFFGPGVVYGQCSELCGVNHSFMPICGEVVSCEAYALWLLPKNCPAGKSIWDYCLYWGGLLWWGCGRVAYWTSFAYLGWWKIFGYYFVYMPVKVSVDTTVSVVEGSVRSCCGVIEWGWWFLMSPREAGSYAVTKVDGWVDFLFTTILVGPVKATWNAFGTIGSIIKSAGSGLMHLIESLMGEMGGPDESATKRAVSEEVRVQMVRFFRVMVSRYRGD